LRGRAVLTRDPDAAFAIGDELVTVADVRNAENRARRGIKAPDAVVDVVRGPEAPPPAATATGAAPSSMIWRATTFVCLTVAGISGEWTWNAAGAKRAVLSSCASSAVLNSS
jgi:hypothetical protein